ncbi:GrpB family protein [Noviherbaspirillum cavernae]|uniref:GrpB family protein n=1 Tax=Noviherbaspirillum cavernae TaxID=2320862 RepID=A0A418WV49_9BURK|nr:GrpB family protein [Noviherbaspirillum cavernae]RJF96518.1 GrpB family protein [Noviherbaspirillum cavernae]
MKIEVVPCNPLWPAQFESERLAIERSLGDIVVQAHHIGSTAVKGLAAKPIIDIILEVRSLEALDQAASALELMDYEAMGEFGISGRRYFRKGGSFRTHQIHAFKAGDPNIFRHLAFRDYLNHHPDVRREYQELKIRLATECNDDLDFYCDGKDAFVKHHEAKAIEWKNGMDASTR